MDAPAPVILNMFNTVSGNGFRLITLGRLVLLSPSGAEDGSLRTRRRKMALLAVLALAERPYSREVLADMFWGEESEEHARHSLSDALSHIRRVLGHKALATRQTDVALSRATGLTVDALEFAEACHARDHARALSLYDGPFLDGVYVARSPRFEEWLTRTRSRFEQLFTRACDAQCMALARARQWDECHAVALRWLEASPMSVDAALYLINARKAPDTSAAIAAALTEYDALSQRLMREYHATPDARVVQLAADLRARLAARSDAPAAPAIPVARNEPASVAPTARTDVQRGAIAQLHAGIAPARRRWRTVSAVALAAIVGAGGITAWMSRDATARSPIPIVAVTLIQNTRHDTSVAWLQDGLKQMIAADLSRSAAVEVVAPARVRDVIARSQFGAGHALTTDNALQIARRVGATWAVSGGITKGNGEYVVDVGVRDAASGKLLRLFTVTGSDILAIADEAASRILSTADGQTSGPHLAAIETSNVGAYQHYVRAIQAGSEGRYADQIRELDAAIAADSGFVSAIVERLRVAQMNYDHATEQRLARAFARVRDRASEWDRRLQDLYVAYHNGERSRAEQLARDLVTRFPHDPRAYQWLATIYIGHGRWSAADTVYQHELSLDSLALEAGRGPCAACAGLAGLAWLRLYRGDLAGAEQAARRWVALQPDVPASWSMLAIALTYAGRYREALTTGRRALALSEGDPQYALRVGRTLVMARRFDAADSAARVWLAQPDSEYHANALDLQSIVLRERGQLRAADRVIDTMTARYPETGELVLVKANDLGRLAEWGAATRIYEMSSHPVAPASGSDAPQSPLAPLDGDGARAFCWHHALEADAIAPTGDTARLRVLADSIEMVSARSYYGRDWRLAHHVRGLIAMQAGRYAEAVREFQQAEWGVSGWTVTNADLARAELARGAPRAAITALREAYEAPPNAMGRYAIRSELDLLMTVAFRRAGMADSSAVYARYVRRAWRDADPEVAAQLALLDASDVSDAGTQMLPSANRAMRSSESARSTLSGGMAAAVPGSSNATSAPRRATSVSAKTRSVSGD